MLVNFVFISIIMPYGNFDDNYTTRMLFSQQKEEDPDLTLAEFVFGKLLYVGDLIDPDDDAVPVKTPLDNSSPFQTVQIQAGSIELSKPFAKIEEPAEIKNKPTRYFRDNKFDRKFSSPVFHPPALIS